MDNDASSALILMLLIGVGSACLCIGAMVAAVILVGA